MIELQHSMTLLHGPPLCGKTSLLFDFAVQELLSQRLDKICFVCPQPLARIPAHTGLPENSALLSGLYFKYPVNKKELKKYIIEEFSLSPPCLLVIDQLSSYFSDLPDLYQTLKILHFSLNRVRRDFAKQVKVLMSVSSSSIAAFNKDTLRELVPGQIPVTTHINPKTKENYNSVEGRNFCIVKDSEEKARLKPLELDGTNQENIMLQ